MSSIFLCCDLNVQVTGDVEGITGPHVHASPISSLESREFAFLQLLQNFDMYVCNTFLQGSDKFSYTRVPWAFLMRSLTTPLRLIMFALRATFHARK